MDPALRTVSFDLKPKVNDLYVWLYAYREARKGKWEQAARDRHRFKSKIFDLEIVISPILRLPHRAQIFQQRFKRI